ncbi:GYDIA family GHMP kinase [Aequorivita xiaoshiensis]|uniref:GHMP kinase n=1 Tax=Aequorivita xiaoshiensis TaxID=2874476 RepID=A0A9X1R4N3_9FLAO|nr:GYDIA family GHMP kinase [Aequorivita xiaoshiensis]MCG2431483.1 GHMP kinase [Aequorivita xiaoshiensis]
MNKNFHSNGKLLLTGEYVVLSGASALAIPTAYGQSLKVEFSEIKGVHWESYDENGAIWFSDFFDLDSLKSKNSESPISKTLSNILLEARRLNPEFFLKEKGLHVTTTLNFPRNWGLGTSSTLINNIAQWANVDAFQLLNNSFGGSGYDIAAAQNDTPIVYRITNGVPEINKVHLPWDFTDSIFFVYLNQKQDSKQGISRFKKTTVKKETLKRISEITNSLLVCSSLEEFENLMKEHEQIISEIINLPTVKSKLFSDFSGIVKSLGAWGGDFVLATGNKTEMEYFREKGFKKIVSFADMIKS